MSIDAYTLPAVPLRPRSYLSVFVDARGESEGAGEGERRTTDRRTDRETNGGERERERRVESSREPQRRVRRRNEVPDNRLCLCVLSKRASKPPNAT